MFELIAKPFGILLMWLYNLVGNYGVAIFLFALVVKIILLPFQMKSKKGMIRMAALNPQIEELKKRHEGNQQRLQQEMAKLYKEEKVSPMSGCIWSLIPFPILLALYRAIRYPLTTMMGVDAALVAEGGAIANKLAELGFTSSGNAAYLQLYQSEFISNNIDKFAGLSDKLVAINYSFLGLNLASTPKVFFWNDGVSWASIGLFLIPIISAALSFLQMKISTKTNPTMAGADQTQGQMKMMNYMMPLLSLWIGFSMPAALGIYWISTSLLALIQEVILNKIYGKKLEEEKAIREAKQREKEAEIERRRQETERLRAEGQTRENENTSKKKQQARQKNELDQLKAAAQREEKAARRARLGIPEAEEKPASQVGNRRYARGRAYVADRYTNPEHAAEATAAAAAESEGAAAIDETVEETAPAAEEVREVVTDPAPASESEEETAEFESEPEEDEDEPEADDEPEEEEDDPSDEDEELK